MNTNQNNRPSYTSSSPTNKHKYGQGHGQSNGVSQRIAQWQGGASEGSNNCHFQPVNTKRLGHEKAARLKALEDNLAAARNEF
jgi:hypothetical protein